MSGVKEYKSKDCWAIAWENRGRRVWEIFKKGKKNEISGVYHVVWEGNPEKDYKQELKEFLKLMEENIEKICFSPRPYKAGQCCDGSIDACVMALFFDFCEKNNLDWKELYKKAYRDENPEETDENYLKELAEWQGVEYPEIWDDESFKKLLKSFTEINYHSLEEVLATTFEEVFSESN